VQQPQQTRADWQQKLAKRRGALVSPTDPISTNGLAAGIHTGRSEGLWKKMFDYFQFRRDEFLTHYHKRSNVESTFSMIKAKFRYHIRSKTDVAMVNEVLCKIICHNICCLIQESHELGIEAEFWGSNN
jgi:hypothetical protein